MCNLAKKFYDKNRNIILKLHQLPITFFHHPSDISVGAGYSDPKVTRKPYFERRIS